MIIIFYSDTYPGDDIIKFLICCDDLDEGESEEIVIPLLNTSTIEWEVFCEDTHQANLAFSNENFENAKQELIRLGFQYGGKASDSALE